MELNEEVVKKALDWLDSLVGNSNDSDMAIFTYQLLGILYDTCEELTEENERLQDLVKEVQEYNEAWVKDNHDLRAENERLVRANSAINNAVLAVDRMAKANTVRQMQERFNEKIAKLLISPSIQYQASAFIDQIAKEMLEGENEN